MTPRRPFELAIGALVLEGFQPDARHPCVTAFTREFERLARQRGLPEIRLGSAPEWRIPALSIAASAGDPPWQVGRALARSLFQALHRAAGGV